MSANSSRRDLRVNTFTSGRQEQPDIAIGSLDNFVITWQSERQDGDGFGIFGRSYGLSGAPLASEFQVNSTTQGDQTDAAVAADGSGNFVVVWSSDQANGRGLYAQRFQANGERIGAEFGISFSSGFNSFQQQGNPDVGMDALGNFVVVYESRGQNNNSLGQDTSGTGIFGQRFNATGATVGSEFRVNTWVNGNQTAPAVAVNGLGEFVVTWVSPSLSGNGIFGQRYSSTGQPLGIEFQVNRSTRGQQDAPAVAYDDNGNFVVAWQGTDGRDGDGFGIYAQRYDASGNPSGDELLVNSTTRGDQLTPAVAIDGSGAFTIVWSGRGDSRRTAVFGQRYLANGSRDGGEFQVNDSSSNDQINPVVALSSSADFVVAWQDQDNRGDDNILARTNVFKRQIRGTRFADNLRGTDQSERILGLGASDRLQGLGGSDILQGGNGSDRLEGGKGDDILQGGTNDDILEGGSGNDRLTGGGGVDTFVLGLRQGSKLITDFEAGVDRLGLTSGLKPNEVRIEQQGENVILSARGSRLATLLGVQTQDISTADFEEFSSTGRRLRGTNRADTLVGGGNSDEIFGLGGKDTLSGRGGDDLIEGGSGSDELLGEAGADTLVGGAGNDKLTGGDGDDILQADDGRDTLIGGAGADEFFLQRKTGLTTIQDFQDGLDQFSLDAGINPRTLVLRAQGADTLIISSGQILALVQNIAPSQINTGASDFV